MVLVVVLALAGGGVLAWSVLRGDGGSAGSAAGRGWNLIVTQDVTTGTITVRDASGAALENLAEIDTDLRGLADTGVPGSVLVGTAGDVEIDGIGLLDTTTGRIRRFEVGDRQLLPLGTSGWWVLSEPTGTALEVLDIAGRELVDLIELAGIDTTVEPPIAPGSGVRIDPSGAVLAFSEFRSSSTVVVDLDERAAVTVPGDLADVTATRVATTTNRGETALLDLSDLTGTRLGTVEVPRPAGVLVVDDTTVLTVALDGTVRRVDFSGDDPDVAELPAIDLPDSGPLSPAGRLAGSERLAVRGDDFVALVDPLGNLVGTVPVTVSDQFGVRTGPDAPSCTAIVGRPEDPIVVVDTRTASVVHEFPNGRLLFTTDDQCTVAVANLAGTRTDVRGPDVSATFEATVVALAPDGSAVVASDRTGAALFDTGSDESTDLGDARSFAVFVQRRD
jgi:hypothetical protein